MFQLHLLVSYACLLCVFISKNLVSSLGTVNVVGVYDDQHTSTKKYGIYSSLRLACNVTTNSSDITVIWEKEGKVVGALEELKGRTKISNEGGLHNLTISHALEGDAGNYSCVFYSAGSEVGRATIIAASQVYVKTPKNINVVEGERLKIHCEVLGKPLPELSWFVERHLVDGTTKNETYHTSTDRVTLEKDDNNVPNAYFIIKEVMMDDRGNYSCRGYSNVTGATDQSFTMVRIKDKYAALWPFIGICAEVFVLCAVILIYEKKRNKTELEESDTDQSPDQKNTPDHGGKDSNLRHRQ